MSRDRNGQTESSRPKRLRPKWLKPKSRVPEKGVLSIDSIMFNCMHNARLQVLSFILVCDLKLINITGCLSL